MPELKIQSERELSTGAHWFDEFILRLAQCFFSCTRFGQLIFKRGPSLYFLFSKGKEQSMRVQIFVNGLNDVVGKIPFCSPFVWPISIRKNPYIDYSGAIRPVYVTHGVMKFTSYLAIFILIVTGYCISGGCFAS